MIPFPFCKTAAPAIPKNCNGLSATHKGDTLQKRGQRFGLRARSWGRETESVGWPKEGQRDWGGTNKGRVFSCMGNKTRPLGKNDILDIHRFWGACDPGGFGELGEG